MIPKPGWRGFLGKDSLTKRPFKVTSSEVVKIRLDKWMPFLVSLKNQQNILKSETWPTKCRILIPTRLYQSVNIFKSWPAPQPLKHILAKICHSYATHCIEISPSQNKTEEKTTPSRWFKVTFWFPSWRSQTTIEKGHVHSPSQKGHQQNCPVFDIKRMSAPPKLRDKDIWYWPSLSPCLAAYHP